MCLWKKHCSICTIANKIREKPFIPTYRDSRQWWCPYQLLFMNCSLIILRLSCIQSKQISLHSWGIEITGRWQVLLKISKVRVDNQIQKGKLSKYRIDSATTVVVIELAPRQTWYINTIFYRVDVVTRGQRMQEYDMKRKKLNDIENIYKLNFGDGINT